MTVTVGATNSLPVPTIESPDSSLTWAVDDTISFQGGATDDEDGDTRPRVRAHLDTDHAPLRARWVMPHPHHLDGTGRRRRQFDAPGHEYPSHLELQLDGHRFARRLQPRRVSVQPKTVDLTFPLRRRTVFRIVAASGRSRPRSPKTFIIGSVFTATAVTPQTIGSTQYDFTSWSDSGAQSHEIAAPSTPTTYTATYATANTVTTLPAADANIRSNQPTKNFGTATDLRVRSAQSRSYLRFVVSGVTGTVTSAKLRLRVDDGSANGGRIYTVTGAWTETGITWNNAPVISGAPIATVGAATVATWKEVNLGTFVTGNGTYNFAISDGSNDAVDYRSRETVDDPQLVLTVTP